MEFSTFIITFIGCIIIGTLVAILQHYSDKYIEKDKYEKDKR